MTPSPETQPRAPLDIDEVLDAAVDAFVNDGLDAVSFRRLASTLGIDESEVVQLFPSIEQLLDGMLNREYSGMFRTIVDDIDRDPLGGRLSRIYRYMLSAVYERPLARALFLMDRDGLNRITRATHGFTYIPQFSVRPEFIDRMKVAGVARTDVDSQAVAAVMSAVSAGVALLGTDQQLGAAVDGLAQFLERTVDTDGQDTSGGKAEFISYVTGPGGGSGSAADDR